MAIKKLAVLPVAGAALSFTVHGGAARLTPDSATQVRFGLPKTLLARADEALLMTMSAGRNHLEFFTATPVQDE
jgi:hypothetical protein